VVRFCTTYINILEETRNACRILVESFFGMITWKIMEVGGRDYMEIGCEDEEDGTGSMSCPITGLSSRNAECSGHINVK
jgi:hypothetical protein